MTNKKHFEWIPFPKFRFGLWGMERRSRSQNRRSSDQNRHTSLGRDNLGPTQKPLAFPSSSLHSRPGGDSRTLSPDRRNSNGTTFPKTSPHHNKAGSYNHYTQPPLTLPTSIALGINGSTRTINNNNPPAPLPPRVPVSSSANSLLKEARENNNNNIKNSKVLLAANCTPTTSSISSGANNSSTPPASLQHVSSPQQQVSKTNSTSSLKN